MDSVDKDDDLRATLEAAYAEATSAPEPAPEPAAEAVPDTPEPEAKAEPTSDRPRDERGRFVSGEEKPADAKPANTDAAPTAPAATPEGSGQKPDAQTASAPVAPEGAPAPPVTWSSEAKTKWTELPEWAQREVHKRELESRRALSKMDEERAFAKSIQQALTPVSPLIQSAGLPPAQYLSQLVQTDHFIRTADPQQLKQTLLNFAAQRGITFTDAPSDAPDKDATIAQLQQRLATLESGWQTREQQSKAQQEALIQSEIQKFSSDPANIHFEQVKDVMAGLLVSGRAQSLKDAYEQAIWADPAIRESILAAKNAERLAEQRRKDAEAAKAAKAKAKSVVGGPGAVAPARPPERDLRGELEAAFAEFGGRA